MTKTARHTRPAPPGCVWIDEASRLTGLAVKTLYNYRSRGEGGPRSGTIARRPVYRLTDIDEWRAAQFEPSPEQEHESRPAELRTPREQSARIPAQRPAA